MSAAFVAVGVFLGPNGWYLDAPEANAERVVLALAGGTMAEGDFAAWLRANCYRAPE